MRASLLPAAGIAVVVYAATNIYNLLMPVVLIALGLYILFWCRWIDMLR